MAIRQRQRSVIARSYAEALFRAAEKVGAVDELARECETLEEVFRRNATTLFYLGSPQVPTEDKVALIDRVFAPRVSPLLTRMLKMMVERERVDYLVETLDYVQELIERARGIYPAIVASALELDAADRQRLQAALERYTGCRLNIEYQVDPNLIGGIVFRFRDTLIDGSLRAGLDNLRRRLLETALPSA